MRGLLALLLCCLPLCPSFAGEPIVIAAFGDSLFAGYGVAPKDSFPSQLEKRLTDNGYAVRMINDGISGDTTAGGVARLESVIAQKPDIVIVGLGANDMLRGLQPEQARYNLDMILTHLQASRITKLIVMGQKAPASYGNDYVKAFDPLFCDLARKHDALCYPFFFTGIYLHPELMQADGMHPNAAGVKSVVDQFYPVFLPLLQ